MIRQCPVTILLSLTTLAWAAEPLPDKVDYNRDIKPILSDNCYACHGPDEEQVKGGLRLDSFAAATKELKSGARAIVPKDTEESELVYRVHTTDADELMPPAESNKSLTAREKALLKKWVAQGGEFAKHWAYVAPKKTAAPKVEQKGFTRNDIDRFILARLKANGFAPANEVDRRVLIRRLSFDLTGLPPTWAEVQAFVNDKSPDAYSKLVDRLLASPHYGERMAVYWLDMVRFADTIGYHSDNHETKPLYREYVINSFNDNKKYDLFTREQIAGDELADASLRRRISDWNQFQNARQNGNLYNARESEQLVASSFLRMGPWDPAMVKKPQARQIYLDDVVNAVGETFLSTTMRCFKCHDHKFDPLPTRDYYRMYAVFEPTQLAERPTPFLEQENRVGLKEGETATRKLLAFATDKHNALYNKQESAARAWFAKAGTKYLDEKARQKLPDEEKPPRLVGLSSEEQGRKKVRRQDEWIWERRLERYQPLAQSVYNGPVPNFLNARKLRMNARANNQWRPDSRILSGGSLEAPGAAVTPGVLSALGVPVPGAKASDPYQIKDPLDGRRLALARWIADPGNPLTARSIVNRVWQQHFGQPLAANPNNLGAKGGKPTHPELLDWLAAEFAQPSRLEGTPWSMKEFIRILVTSDAFRRSSAPSAMGLQKDAGSSLLWRFPPRRVEAEVIRDGILLASGKLNPEMGGRSYRIHNVKKTYAQWEVVNNFGPETWRRMIYQERMRRVDDRIFTAFDFPDCGQVRSKRPVSTPPLQALNLMNSEFVVDQSKHLAERANREAGDGGLPVAVNRTFELLLSRKPSKDERKAALEVAKARGLAIVCRSLINSNEFAFLP